MIQIRNNVFETNSSSTHCMVIGTDDQFAKWESGELYYYDGWSSDLTEGFVSKEEAEKFIEKCHPGIFDIEDEDERDDALNEVYRDEYIWTMDAYCTYRGEYLECDENSYTTPGGETIRILCHYGYDG